MLSGLMKATFDMTRLVILSQSAISGNTSLFPLFADSVGEDPWES